MAQKKKAVQASSKQNIRSSRSAEKAGKTKDVKSKTTYGKNFGDTIYDEIIMLVLILLSIMVLISLFTSVTGAFGNIVGGFSRGVLGIGAYFLPVGVIIYCVWLMAKKDHSHAAAKAVGLLLFVLCVSTFFQLVTNGASNNYSNMGLLKRMTYFYKDASPLNGGMTGGTAGYLLYKALGWGSYIVSLAGIIISLMLATGGSVVSLFGSMADNYREKRRIKEYEIKAKADNIREKEEKRAKKQELEDMKLQQKRDRVYEIQKHKKGNFNILINGEEGCESEAEKAAVADMPVVEAVVFKKNEEPPKPEAEENAYDFCREVPDEKEMEKGEKFIEVLGAVNEEPDEKNVLLNNIFGVNDDDAKAPESTVNNTREPEKDTEYLKNEINASDYEYENDSVADGSITGENISDNTEVLQDAAENFDKVNVDDNAAGGVAYDAAEQDTAAKPNKALLKKAAAAASKAALPDTAKIGLAVVPDVKAAVEKPKIKYNFPSVDLLGKEPESKGGETKADMLSNAKKLEDTLLSFGVQAKVIQINKGPTVTRYELAPSQGVKVSKIVNLSDDIALNLAATGIRIEAPIPGKAAVGIEVPNAETQSVYLRSVIESDVFKNAKSKLTFALGKDIAGNAVVTDIAKMPHLLIAGATGSGKSVCINTIITSILYKATPDEVKMLLVDPKVVELSVYNGIPHLLIPVVTDPKKAAGALNWAVKEMLTRYQTFAECRVRDIKGYNAMKKEKGEEDLMPQIVIIIDELADLMMAAPGDVEEAICRLAQLARAAGMHLIIATQRPSVDVITGVIKANIPSRLAFAVSSGIDSRTILDSVGAEKLIGKGDMLFYPVGMNKPVRIQGAFVTDNEVENIVEYVKSQYDTSYDQSMVENITGSTLAGDSGDDKDEFFDSAVDLVVEKEKASVSMIQRQFRIGYNRAARIVEDMEKRGIVGPEDGSKPRKVLISKDELDSMKDTPQNADE